MRKEQLERKKKVPGIKKCNLSSAERLKVNVKIICQKTKQEGKRNIIIFREKDKKKM